MKLIISLTVFLFLLGCMKKNPNKNKLKLDIEKKVSTETQKVVITGISDDIKALSNFLILNDTYLFTTNHKYSKKNIFTDSISIVLDSVKKPQLFEVWVGSDTLFHAKIFITPGDTLTFNIKNKKLRFTGKNASYNNFFIDLERETPNYRNIPYIDNVYDYKQNIKTGYNQKLKFLNKFRLKNENISSIFIYAITSDLKFEYLLNLVQPRSIFVESQKWYVNNQNGFSSSVVNEYIQKEDIFDQREYFDNLSLEDFKRPELLNNHFFKNSLDAYIRHYFVSSEYLDYSKEKFLAEKKFIQKNFEGDLEYYAIARMIREYNIRGFGYSTSNINILKTTIKEYDSIFSTKPSYKEKIDKISESLDRYKFRLSKEALNSKLISQLGDTITLRDVFNNTSGKTRVLDFWASWCPPCISEIKKVKKFKDRLANENHIEWIYLSIDKDKNKWLKKTYELQEYLNTKNQYLILGGKNSSLAKSLKVTGIPRYVIFNKKKQIIVDNAPRPSDSLVFKKIINEIK